MIDSIAQARLKEAIADCVGADQGILDKLREEIRTLRGATRRIKPRIATTISIVGTDGGNYQLKFDPFLIQLVRVVDSSNNEYCLEAVSPTTPIDKLNNRQFSRGLSQQTALGEMMEFLGVTTLQDLSHMIRPTEGGRPISPSWIQVYRELVEWATLFSILKKDFGNDTLVVYDGLLRSKVFAKDLFQRLLQGMHAQIMEKQQKNQRRTYLVGVAKHSKVLSRYRLAMALEKVLQVDYPAYVEVPRDIEEQAYIWSEYARGDDRVGENGEINKFVGGKMFLVKFGSHRRDPVWPVDVFVPQIDDASVILGSLLGDTINGFPVPHYPLCLQKAYENASLVDFDFDILQDFVYEGVRTSLKGDASTLDVFRLQDTNSTRQRY